MFLVRPVAMRTFAGGIASLRGNPTQQFARRSYAATHEVKKSSDLPWTIVSIGVSVPVLYYLYESGNKKDEHHDHKSDEH
ncbi:uncharacterized protein BJX67DRAFT_378017 [Aspergillus lucknowensis]|uniref:Uncharacterized protein n=1 Tax=Aspergillus lucknowensis TaxID=176173 RepID=A0ABR4M1J7_9EURO